MQACELLAIELRLDRIEAELEAELPAHVRSFARAHARGVPAPPAPDVLRRQATLATARAALVHPVLADRGLALLRLAAPVALESDPAVIAARAAPPTWEALAALAAARDAAALARFGRRAIDVLHHLHGGATGATGAADAAGGDSWPAVPGARIVLPGGRATGLPPAVAGWFDPDGVAVGDGAIARAWDELRAGHGVGGTLRLERTAIARPRAFVVEPRREVIVVLPERIAAPAGRFAALHELGHAVAALALDAGLPRVVDEAAAAYVAGAIEREACAWYSPLAGAARARRRALAHLLDRIERALPELPALASRPAERPPWALWHDPGAQAAYVAAEALAEDVDRALGPSPAPGALAAVLAARCDAIARATSAI